MIKQEIQSVITRKEGGMAWVYLFVAGVFEIVWATGLKHPSLGPAC